MTLTLLLFSSLLWPPSSAAEKSPTTVLCEKEGGKREKPKLVVKSGAGKTLFLCGHSEKKKGKLEVSGFRVFALRASGKKLPGHVFEPTAENVPFRAFRKRSALVLDELVSTGRESVPAFETRIECNRHGCQVSAPVCVFQPPRSISKKALVQVHAYMNGAKRGSGPDEQLIGKLAGLAYSGDPEAQAIFDDRGSLTLDGAAGEAYFEHKTMLGRLKNAGCLAAAPPHAGD